jgi:antitoxin component YwqK of YwqJK toxin-antitoxin module
MCRGFCIGLIIVSFFLVTGCKSNEIKVIQEKFDDGKPKTERFYLTIDDQKLLIKEIQYYPSGIVKLEGEYENNKKNGTWIFYYETGEVWSEGYFADGERTGKTLVYHENGQLFYEGEYLKGQKQGNWKFYSQEGKLVNNVLFEKGKMTGKFNDKESVKDSSLSEQ